MEYPLEITCCFTGHRPEKLPWKDDESDPRCVLLKQRIAEEVRGLYDRGFRRFISGMARGGDFFFAEAVVELRKECPGVFFEAAVPFPGQAKGWAAGDSARYRALLLAADLVTTLCGHYHRGVMHVRDRYMVQQSAAVLAVCDGRPGGTRFTVDYASKLSRELLLLDPHDPDTPPTRLVKQP